MKRPVCLILMFLLPLIITGTCLADQDNYRARLSGNQQVPKVKTPATGLLKLAMGPDGLIFQLDVDDITSPTAANIHMGRKGENGPPVAGLFGGPAKMGPFSGILSEGGITDQSLLGELQGKTVADLLRLLRTGKAYVNILTTTYPLGEIRGQIIPQ